MPAQGNLDAIRPPKKRRRRAILTTKSYDAIVVGGGIVGLTCAWRVAQRGMSVLAIERERPGAGASGVAAGMLAPVTEAEFGEEALLRLNLAAAEAWPAFAAELGERTAMPTGYRHSGALVAAADRDDVEELRRLHRFQQSLGLDAEWLSGRDCRRLEPGLSPRVPGGVLAPHDHQVDPQAVTAALAVALEHAGGELLRAEVTRIDGGVTLAGGRTISAGQIVLAAGCWSRELAPDVPVRPVRGQVLQCRIRGGTTGPLASRIVRTPRCYVLDRGDGRVVIGATVEERGFDTTVTVDGVYRLLEAAWEVLPDVGELELVGARAGLRPGTPDNRPVVGRFDDGVVLATGHYRNGILLAPVTAQEVAAVLAGGDGGELFDGCRPERFAAARRLA